jgi:hypothetical protein
LRLLARAGEDALRGRGEGLRLLARLPRGGVGVGGSVGVGVRDRYPFHSRR